MTEKAKAEDATAYNRRAWDEQVARGNPWTVPASPEAIERARRGDVSVVLTPSRPVPAAWLGELRGANVLGVGSGGGQQMPLLAAAGARVTSLDNSPRQLERDREVAAREGLSIETVVGDMTHLEGIPDRAFDLVFQPCSNSFVPALRPVWQACFRVLRPGGRLLAGFLNPLYFLFDEIRMRAGELVVRHAIPYSDAQSLTAAERQQLAEANEPLVFGHTLEDEIGGQLAAGFLIAGFYEDRGSDDDRRALSRYIDWAAATWAVRPTSPPEE